MCSACPGYSLLNPTKSRLIKAPFMVLHVDTYMAGSLTGFEGSEMYLVTCCGMCTFGTLKPVSSVNATMLAPAIIKIQLHFGFCHTIVFGQGQTGFMVFAMRH
jgi:hypothetical protein